MGNIILTNKDKVVNLLRYFYTNEMDKQIRMDKETKLLEAVLITEIPAEYKLTPTQVATLGPSGAQTSSTSTTSNNSTSSSTLASSELPDFIMEVTAGDSGGSGNDVELGGLEKIEDSFQFIDAEPTVQGSEINPFKESSPAG